MGSKHGKYDFERGSASSNGQGTLPSYPTDANDTTASKLPKRDVAFTPKCIHRDSVGDPFSSTADHLSLVWLDTDFHRRPSNIDTEVKLKNLIRYTRLFDRVDACERYIKQIGRMNSTGNSRKEQLLVMISTALAPTLIPHLHDLPQVKYIYVYGKPKSISKAHQEWIKRNSKVKGVFSSSRSLVAQISQDQN